MLELAPGLEVDRGTRRHVKLLVGASDGAEVEVELLRPVNWLREEGFEAGAPIPVSFTEMGATILARGRGAGRRRFRGAGASRRERDPSVAGRRNAGRQATALLAEKCGLCG